MSRFFFLGSKMRGDYQHGKINEMGNMWHGSKEQRKKGNQKKKENQSAHFVYILQLIMLNVLLKSREIVWRLSSDSKVGTDST